MGLSQRVTELLESWLGIGEHLAQTSPRVTISNGVDDASVIMADGEFGLVTITPAHISTLNSYSGTIASGGTWVGTEEEIVNHGVISVIVTSTQDSAIDGFNLEYSTDGITWVDGDLYTLTSNITKIWSFQCSAKYFRIFITNGTDGIATVDLQTVLKPYYVKPSSHRVNDVISPQDDAELTKNVLTAQRLSDNLFVPINASTSGNLQITDAENPLAIAKGEVVGSSDINKFGNAPDFDQSDGEVDIWDAAEDGEAWEQMNIILPISNTIDSISSTDALDTGIELTVVGLDINYNIVTQVPILDGQNRVALTTPLLRHFRSYNSNGTLFVGHIIIYENTAINLGVPVDTTKIQGVVHPENQQTEMAIYTIPAGYTGYLTSGYTSTAGSNKTSNYVIRFKIKEFNKVFRLQQKVAVSDSGTSFINFKYDIPQPIPEKSDIKVTAEMRATGGTGASVSAGFSIILVEN